MEGRHLDHQRNGQSTRGRVIASFTLALAIALSAFFLINVSKANHVAFGSMWFLVFLPAYLCAFICYVGDPNRDKSVSFYAAVPPLFGGIVVVGSAWFLHEGVICLIMLAPLWLGFSWLGAFIMRSQRRRSIESNTFRSTLILLPLFSGGLESQIPVPHAPVTLAREIIIKATPEEIWPYAVSNPQIAESEGRWNFTQNVLGLPRPRATKINGAGKGPGIGSVRTAYWGDKINFDERITHWQPGRRLGWSFSFTNSTLQDYTDKHIAPDGEFLKIDTGDYTLTPVTRDTTRLTLRTNYIAKTHVHSYAEFWGEILLGDIQNNILAIIKARAEARHQSDRL
jgi:hypothetical protein